MPSDIHAALGNVFHLYVTHHLSLSSCHIEDWAFSLFESSLFATIYFKHFYSFAIIQPKISKTLASFIVLFTEELMMCISSFFKLTEELKFSPYLYREHWFLNRVFEID